MVRKSWSSPRRFLATGLLAAVITLTLGSCGGRTNFASAPPPWTDAEAATVLALLDHEQAMVALGRQGEAMATDSALAAEARGLARRATQHSLILDRALRAGGFDVSERIRIRSVEVPTVAMTCGVSRGDALGVLAQTPPPQFDDAFRALVAQMATVESGLMEAAAGIEPASSALQALA